MRLAAGAGAPGRSAEDNLAGHVARGHVTRAEREASAIEAAADTVAARIADLPAGTAVLVSEVSQWCSISRKQAAVVLQALAARYAMSKVGGLFVVAG